MPLTAAEAGDNHLLASLPREDRDRWQTWLQPVTLAAGQVLHEARQPPRCVYFPCSAVVSLQVQSEDGRCDEVALVGREGMVGVSALVGSSGLTIRSVVQQPGRAWRLDAERMRAEFEGSRTVLRVLLLYLAAQEAEVAQRVVCSRHHSIEQRLCLRLLQGIDCQEDRRLEMTHEQLSGWLGVRRGSVTKEARKLQEDGLITYTRGHIVVLDRAGLERRSCECYALLSGGQAASPVRMKSIQLPAARNASRAMRCSSTALALAAPNNSTADEK